MPIFSFEVKLIPIPSLSQSFLHKYKPIPVDFPKLRPFSPVNPFSNTLSISFSFIPTPLSLIVKTILFSFTFDDIETSPLLGIENFIAFIIF